MIASNSMINLECRLQSNQLILLIDKYSVTIPDKFYTHEHVYASELKIMFSGEISLSVVSENI